MADPDVERAQEEAARMADMLGYAVSCGELFSSEYDYDLLDMPIDISGRWVWTTDECAITFDSNGAVGDRCAGEITFTEVADNTYRQMYMGGVVQGSGDVYARGSGEGFYLFQRNEASGAGCTQSITNLIAGATSGPGAVQLCIFTVIHSSTCAAPRWQETQATWRR